MDFRKWDGTWRTERDWNMNNRTQKHYGSWILENGVWNMENRKRFEHEQQNLIRTWTTEKTWNKDTRTGLKHEKQIMFVTRIPEQVWNQRNMENMTASEQGQDWSMDNRTKMKHGQQNKIGT